MKKGKPKYQLCPECKNEYEVDALAFQDDPDHNLCNGCWRSREKKIDDYVFCRKCENNPCICKPESWEAELSSWDGDSKDLIIFVNALLKSEREKLLGEIREKLPKERKWNNESYEEDEEFADGYNKCLSEIKSLIKKL